MVRSVIIGSVIVWSVNVGSVMVLRYCKECNWQKCYCR